jgi:hypothetical protein
MRIWHAKEQNVTRVDSWIPRTSVISPNNKWSSVAIFVHACRSQHTDQAKIGLKDVWLAGSIPMPSMIV